MNSPLNSSNGGVAFVFDFDEDGEPITVVTGANYDAVLASALDVKNSLPVDECPEVGEVRQHVDNGCWTATVRTRREAS